jgi:hypothetical protein
LFELNQIFVEVGFGSTTWQVLDLPGGGFLSVNPRQYEISKIVDFEKTTLNYKLNKLHQINRLVTIKLTFLN